MRDIILILKPTQSTEGKEKSTTVFMLTHNIYTFRKTYEHGLCVHMRLQKDLCIESIIDVRITIPPPPKKNKHFFHSEMIHSMKKTFRRRLCSTDGRIQKSNITRKAGVHS